MNEIICPYCDADCGVPDENSDEGVEVEWECPGCEKNFVYWCSYLVSYDSQKADCLNGDKHKWEKVCGIPEEIFKNKRRCSLCGKEKDLNNDIKSNRGQPK